MIDNIQDYFGGGHNQLFGYYIIATDVDSEMKDRRIPLYFNCPYCGISSTLDRDDIVFSSKLNEQKQEIILVALIKCKNHVCLNTTVIAETVKIYPSQKWFSSSTDFLNLRDSRLICPTSDTRIILPTSDEVSIDQSEKAIKKYKDYINKEDYLNLKNAEISHSINLDAAAFLYYRRVLEHLVDLRLEKYSDIQFFDVNGGVQKYPKFKDKLKKLEERGELIFPEALDGSKNNFYGFISEGIHQFPDDECKEYYNLIKAAIIQILNEEIKEKDLAIINKNLLSAYEEIKK